MVAETLESPGRPPGPGSQGAAFPKVTVSGTHSENHAAGTGMPNARLRALTVCALGFAASLKLFSRQKQGLTHEFLSQWPANQAHCRCHWNASLNALWGQRAGGQFTEFPSVRGSEMAEGLILFFYFTHIHFILLPLYNCYTAYKKHQSLIHFPALAQS